MYEEITVDRCTSCGGLWFDWGENLKLRDRPGAAVLDEGNPHVGMMLNQAPAANCPVCDVRLIPMVDQEQPHLWVECCPRCYGVFLDAGEFRDYQRRTPLDYLRDWLAADRI
jgi:Zn-finger nucleic acid-binding protein